LRLGLLPEDYDLHLDVVLGNKCGSGTIKLLQLFVAWLTGQLAGRFGFGQRSTMLTSIGVGALQLPLAMSLQRLLITQLLLGHSILNVVNDSLKGSFAAPYASLKKIQDTLIPYIISSYFYCQPTFNSSALRCTLLSPSFAASAWRSPSSSSSSSSLSLEESP